MPALGISLVLIAVGAILSFAITESVEGANLETIGTILMVVGGIGLVMTLLFVMSFSPFHRGGGDSVVVHDDRV